MPAQQEFFNLLTRLLNKTRGKLDDAGIKKLVLFVKDNGSELKSSYTFSRRIITLTGSNQQSAPLNFIAELLFKILDGAPGEGQLNIDLPSLFEFFKELHDAVNITPLLLSLSNSTKSDIFHHLCVYIYGYHKFYYDQKQKSFKDRLEKAKAIIGFFATHYSSHFKLTKEDLLRAAQFNIPALATAALDQGILVNCQSDDGATPLYFAAQSGSYAVAKILVERGADVNKPQFKEQGPYPVATLVETATTDDDRDFPKLLEYLLLHGANANLWLRNAQNLPLTINAWLNALEVGKPEIISVLLKYASVESGITYPVDINMNHSARLNSYRCAMEGDKTGRVIELLRKYSVNVTKEAQTSLLHNPLYEAMQSRKPLAVIKQLLLVFSPYLPNYETHPLVSVFLDLSGYEGNTEQPELRESLTAFKLQVRLFTMEPNYLNFNAAITLCLLMVKQRQYDFSSELSVILKYIREKQLPTSNIDIATLYLLVNNFIGSAPSNQVLANECNQLRMLPLLDLNDAQSNCLAEAQLRLFVLGTLLNEEKRKEDEFILALRKYYEQGRKVNMTNKVWKIILTKLRSNDFLTSHIDHVVIFIFDTSMVIKDMFSSIDDKKQIAQYMMEFFNIPNQKERMPDEYLELARQHLPPLQRWFFAGRDVVQLILAINYEFSLKRTNDTENNRQLVVLEMDRIIDYLVIFINEKPHGKLTLIAEINGLLQRINKESAPSSSEMSVESWFEQEMLCRRLKLLWLLISYDPSQTKESVCKQMTETMENPLLMQAKDNPELKGYFLSILNKLKGFGLLTNDYTVFSKYGISLADLRPYSHLRGWGKRVEVQERRRQQAEAKAQFTRQLSQQNDDAAPFAVEELLGESKEIEEPTNLAAIATDANERLEYDTNAQEKFWRTFNKAKNERCTPRAPWLESIAQQKQTELDKAAKEAQKKQKEANIRKLFGYELDEHKIPAKTHILKKLDHTTLDGEFWGVFALQPYHFDNINIYNAYLGCFEKGISNNLAGIHNDNGVYRIYPPGDKRAHASVYYKKDENSKPVVMLIFDEESLKHKYYQRTGFYTKNLVSSAS